MGVKLEFEDKLELKQGDGVVLKLKPVYPRGFNSDNVKLRYVVKSIRDIEVLDADSFLNNYAKYDNEIGRWLVPFTPTLTKSLNIDKKPYVLTLIFSDEGQEVGRRYHYELYITEAVTSSLY